MKRIIFTLLTLFLCLQSYAQCEEINENKVLLVGDSWGFFMNVDGTFNTVFSQWGHSNYKYFTNLTLVENGAEIPDFQAENKRQAIEDALNENPSIKVVHVSLGGNDFLGAWNKNMTQEEVEDLQNEVKTGMLEFLDFIKSIREDIQIVFGGYTYPNFQEVIESTAIPTIHPFYGRWEGMGFPTALELNTVSNDFFDLVEAEAAADPRLEFFNAMGFMQYTFGQTEPLGVEPFGTYEPFTQPLPNGDPAYPSPVASMRDYLIFKDCFHLSAQGYRDLIGYNTQKFYHKYFMDDYIIADNAAENGAVSANGIITSNVQLGTDNGETYATHLSFTTPVVANEAVVEKASLFLRRENLVGNTPIDGTVQIAVAVDGFNENTTIEAADFGMMGDAQMTPCTFGSSDDNGHWVRFDLPEVLYNTIAGNSTVQFLISTENSDGLMTFSNTDSTEFAPILNLDWSINVGVRSPEPLAATVKIYPNPSAGAFTIDLDKTIEGTLLVTDVTGKTILSFENIPNRIDLSGFSNGLYVVHIQTNEGVVSEKIVKW